MSTTADAGATLLELQELDLDIARSRKTLAALPELKELARKRKTYQRLKSESTKLYARRKDVEMDLAELDEQELAANAEVDAVQADLARDGTDYRAVQDAEQRLSDLAKRLEKIEFTRGEKTSELEELEATEEKVAGQLERLEATIKKDTQAARTAALKLQHHIDDASSRREALAATLPPETFEAYTAALERFDGLAVEKLEGDIPSICRTTLSPASLSDLRRQGSVGTCPYCRRIIVVRTGDEGGAE